MKKTMMILLAVVLVVAISVGGTLAYFTAKTAPVKNTFTAGSLTDDSFTLQEHKAVQQSDGSYKLSDELVAGNEYEVVPGVNIPKDPFVTVKPDIDAYLFVEIVGVQSGNGWAWGYQEGWTAFDLSVKGPHSGMMFWREVDKSDTAQTFNILSNNEILVGGDLNPADAAGMNLDFYAYLCQRAGFTSGTAAWDAVKADFAVSP